MAEPATARECNTCSQSKPLEAFPKARTCLDGRAPRCKACRVVAQRESAARVLAEEGTVRLCWSCKEEKPAGDFYLQSATGHRHRNCKPCHRAKYGDRKLQRAYALRDRLAAIKLEAGCADCGYRESALALQFDHIPERGRKSFQISVAATGYSRKRIAEELELCDVVCANCHAIRTGSRRTRRTFDTAEGEAA